jgi:hypothetical protein
LSYNNNFCELRGERNKGLAGVIQCLLTIVAQSLRRFERAVGAGGRSVGGRLKAQGATGAAVAQRRSMAGI